MTRDEAAIAFAGAAVVILAIVIMFGA